jgi:PhzF family phenazine biosynthesis protein
MRIPIYQADAFCEQLFSGNPAAVCPLQSWLADGLMQQIAAENNLSETAFFVKEGDHYHIRWFTPGTEVKLCGHATLATAHILFTELGYGGDAIYFTCQSGELAVTRQPDGRLTLNFPAIIPERDELPPAAIFDGLGITTGQVFTTSLDYMVVLDTQAEIEALQPNFDVLAQTGSRGVIVTAKGDTFDFVSRCFYPQSGINEDPVTGSAHTIMVPYWAKQLNKNKLQAVQLSARKGHLDCELRNNRVLMTGNAVTYLRGEIII